MAKIQAIRKEAMKLHTRDLSKTLFQAVAQALYFGTTKAESEPTTGRANFAPILKNTVNEEINEKHQ